MDVKLTNSNPSVLTLSIGSLGLTTYIGSPNSGCRALGVREWSIGVGQEECFLGLVREHHLGVGLSVSGSSLCWSISRGASSFWG